MKILLNTTKAFEIKWCCKVMKINQSYIFVLTFTVLWWKITAPFNSIMKLQPIRNYSASAPFNGILIVDWLLGRSATWVLQTFQFTIDWPWTSFVMTLNGDLISSVMNRAGIILQSSLCSRYRWGPKTSQVNLNRLILLYYTCPEKRNGWKGEDRGDH